jgi:hypothetical protein
MSGAHAPPGIFALAKAFVLIDASPTDSEMKTGAL